MSVVKGKEEQFHCLALVNLPTDVLFLIFKFCDIKTLGRLARVCRLFNQLISEDCVWLKHARDLLVTNQQSESIKLRSSYLLGVKCQLRVSTNWRKSYYIQKKVVSYQTWYMPWLQLTNESLWVSRGNEIVCYRRNNLGHIFPEPVQVLRGHVDDVTKFVLRDGRIVSGGRDGSICGWVPESRQFLFCKQYCHKSDVSSVDQVDNIVVSGSRDKTVQLWNLDTHSSNPTYQVNLNDRVWSVMIAPSGNVMCCGTAGLHLVPPLHLFDLNRGCISQQLGSNYPAGSGMLDIQWESSNIFLSCGYDTNIRLWDLRTGHCEMSWEEPFDQVVYCISTDQKYTILAGTSRYGLVRLWDKRANRCMQMYYTSSPRSSPVYSLTFDPGHLFVALDKSILLLDFTSYTSLERHIVLSR